MTQEVKLQYAWNYDKEFWKKNCTNCNTCCYHTSMHMYTEQYFEESEEAKSFWNREFVVDVLVMDLKDFDQKTKAGLYCPLAIPQGCLIYEDRPLLCKKLFCVMKSGNEKLRE